MNRILLKFLFCIAVIGLVSATSFAQGRGRGNGQGRRNDVFADRDYRGNRNRNENWKCGKFVNCHEARDGRVDGRGRRTTGFWRNGTFRPQGSNVGYRRRYNTNDYWQRRHLTNGTRYDRRWRYR